MSPEDLKASNQPLRFEPSPRWVRVMFNGQIIADSERMRLLHEPGHLPVYYFLQEDVEMEYLRKADHRTQCSLKRSASYWTVNVGKRTAEHAAWSYPYPVTDCPRIENLLCFYNERVDALNVDGELQAKPQTRWSKGWGKNQG